MRFFLKDIETYWETCSVGVDVDEVKVRVLHGLAISLLYGYADYALELFMVAKDMFTGKEHAMLYKIFRNMIQWFSWFPNIKGRSRLACFLHRLADNIEPRGLEKTNRNLGNF